MQTKITALLRNSWLPLYILLSVSWLFAPALHHDHIHQLQLISSYEAFGQPYGWLFRLGDILAFSMLAGAAWHYIGHKSPRYFWLLLSIAILASIDAIFAASSIHQHGWYKFSFVIHDIESVLSAVALAVLSVYDAFQRRRVVSVLFVATQATCGALALLTMGHREIVTVIQYIYTTAGITWLAWLVCSFRPKVVFPQRGALVWRRVFAAWTALNGVALILISVLPTHQQYPWLVHSIDHGYVWVAQHGVIVGIIMLYLARHVRQGQRRAALLVGMLLFSQILIYSIVQPFPLLLALTLLAYAALWYSMPAFKKNVGAPKVASRLADATVVLAGVFLAIGLVFATATITGKQAYLHHTIKRAYSTNLISNAHANLRHRDEALEHSAHRLKHVSYTLSVAVGLALLWSLFRPTRRPNQSQESDKAIVAQLLQQYSRSSEDYFKLWPEDKSYFFTTNRSGFIAYKVTGRTAFVLADPVCAPRGRTQLLAAFTDFCHEQGLSVCVVLIDQASTKLYAKPFTLVKIGSSAVIDIEHFQSTTVRNKWWRWQRNRRIPLRACGRATSQKSRTACCAPSSRASPASPPDASDR